MKLPCILAILLLVAACHPLERLSDNTKKLNNSITDVNFDEKNTCHRMPPLIDKSKLITMLIKNGDINQSDSDVVKLQKLEGYVLNKRKGLSTKCK
jgi:bacillopeptidase F (M6 metalloprotease family)